MILIKKRNKNANRHKWKEAQKRAYKKYYKNNKKKISEIRRKYREKNKNIIKRRMRRWLKTEQGRLLHRLSNLKRKRNLKETSDGSITGNAIRGLFVGQNGLCSHCHTDIHIDYHIDHIIPISKGGEHKIENIQLLCPTCNLRKGNRI